MFTATHLVPSTRKVFAATIATGLTVLAVASIPQPSFASPQAPQTARAWQLQVEKAIDANLTIPAHALGSRDHAVAQVRLHTNSDGDIAQVSLAESSGDAAIDAEALRTARAISYPPLPVQFRGHENSVLMQVYFADSDKAEHHDAYAKMQTTARRLAEQQSGEAATLAKK